MRSVMVDSRIGSAHMADMLSRRGLAVQTGIYDFDVGFYGWTQSGWGIIAFELKKLPDLLSSLSTGRLVSGQLPAMLRGSSMAFLLVESVFRKDEAGGIEELDFSSVPSWRHAKTGWTYDGLAGYLISLMLSVGLIPVFVPDPESAADWIASVYRVTSKEVSLHRSVMTIPKASFVLIPDPPLTARMAAQIEGVGPCLAMRVAERFPSPKAMVNAPVEEWTKIRGIGKSTALRIVRDLGQ